MEHEAGDYKKLAIRQYPARELRETAEGKYWRRFRAPLSAQQASRGGGCARLPAGRPAGAAAYGEVTMRNRCTALAAHAQLVS